MKVIAQSTKHKNTSITFDECVEGVNIRPLPEPRSNYCLDHYTDSTACECGYPLTHTMWEASNPGYAVKGANECDEGGHFGMGYIEFRVVKTNKGKTK